MGVEMFTNGVGVEFSCDLYRVTVVGSQVRNTDGSFDCFQVPVFLDPK